MFIKSTDNIQIHFNVTGSGPVLVLLHGFGNDHSMWAQTGWIERLEHVFTVVAIDFRGCGKSDKPQDPAAYSLANHFADIDNVLETIHGNNPIIWGWSLGATVALHYAAKRKVAATIACGSYFGMIFSDDYIKRRLSEVQDPISIARLKAFNSWPMVFPGDIKSTFLIYTGTADGNVVTQLRKQRVDIVKADGELIIFDDLDHMGLVSDVKAVGPPIINFLRNAGNRKQVDSV